MSYATEAELIAWCGMHGSAELTELTDPDNSAIDSAVVADKLAQADNEINARLPGLPGSGPYPRLLVDIACRLARYFLYTKGRPDYVEADYQFALKTLDDIRLGKASLGLASDGTPAVNAAIPAITTRPAVFTSTVLDLL